MKLNRDFYTVDAYHLAQNLLGKTLCIKKNDVIHKYKIVETEAYGGAFDKACHAYNFRRTARTETLYLEGGHVYVYLIYGMYYMLNITASLKEVPEAVLIRALEPINVPLGPKTMNGPGKLCKALGIDKSFNCLDLTTSNHLYIEDENERSEIISSKRINIDYAEEDKDRLWRFYIKDNQHVSKK